MATTHTIVVNKDAFSPDTLDVNPADVIAFSYGDSNSSRNIAITISGSPSVDLFGGDCTAFLVTSSHTRDRPLNKTVGQTEGQYSITTEKQTGASPEQPMTANIKVVKKG